MLHSFSVSPVRLRRWSPSLEADYVRVIGYRFVCRCGVHGRIEKTFAVARAEGHSHALAAGATPKGEVVADRSAGHSLEP
jgi:hypothetical protein